MKLTFLGTRGNITRRNRWHYNHASLMVSYRRTHIMIDCGQDWYVAITKNLLHPHAIFITHAHSDHAAGLVDGVPCPVYATKESWQVMKNYAIANKHTIKPRNPITIGSITVEAFTVDHAINAPAVGYRISSPRTAFFYVPDLIKIHDQHEALTDIQVYIGDGAIVTRTLLERKRDHIMIGHTPIIKQLKWCKEERVPWAIFSHCGSEIVKRNHNTMNSIIAELGMYYKVRAQLAYDGMEITLKP